MRLPHRLQGQKVKSQGGAEAYCGGHLAAQLVFEVYSKFSKWRHVDYRFMANVEIHDNVGQNYEVQHDGIY